MGQKNNENSTNVFHIRSSSAIYSFFLIKGRVHQNCLSTSSSVCFSSGNHFHHSHQVHCAHSHWIHHGIHTRAHVHLHLISCQILYLSWYISNIPMYKQYYYENIFYEACMSAHAQRVNHESIMNQTKTLIMISISVDQPNLKIRKRRKKELLFIAFTHNLIHNRFYKIKRNNLRI